MQTIEFKQVRGDGRAAPDLVHVKNVQPVARAGIVLGPIHSAEGRAQSKPADAAHTIDTDPHASGLPVHGKHADRAKADFIEATFSAIRSSFASGKLTKIEILRWRLA